MSVQHQVIAFIDPVIHHVELLERPLLWHNLTTYCTHRESICACTVCPYAAEFRIRVSWGLDPDQISINRFESVDPSKKFKQKVSISGFSGGLDPARFFSGWSDPDSHPCWIDNILLDYVPIILTVIVNDAKINEKWLITRNLLGNTVNFLLWHK